MVWVPLGTMGCELPEAVGGPGLTGGASALTQASECQSLPMDQRDSLMPPIEAAFPIGVQLDPSLPQEVQESATWAMSVWNQFAKSQLGYEFFEIKRWDASLRDSRPQDSGDCSFDKADEQMGFRVFRVETLEAWRSLGFSESNPAATLRCQSKGRLTRQTIGLYLPSLRAGQTRSVVLHELGHALGLDHSCEMRSNGNERFVACQEIPAGHPYRIASMYPTLRVGSRSGSANSSGSTSSSDEVKEMLQENDRTRAFCLYRGRSVGGAQ